MWSQICSSSKHSVGNWWNMQTKVTQSDSHNIRYPLYWLSLIDYFFQISLNFNIFDIGLNFAHILSKRHWQGNRKCRRPGWTWGPQNSSASRGSCRPSRWHTSCRWRHWGSAPTWSPLCLRRGPKGQLQGCDRYKYLGSPNQIQNQIRLILLVQTDTKIPYH